MRIDQMLADRREPVFSFEFFPPDDDAATERLFRVIARLQSDAHPNFVSVTCRNNSRLRTLELVKRIHSELDLEPMAHFTCAGATRKEMHRVLEDLRDSGIQNVLALRGDAVAGSDGPVTGGEDLAHGSDLVRLISDGYDFCIGAATYPDPHAEAETPDADVGYSKLKVDGGASFLITNMFFDNGRYFDHVARLRALGVTAPVIPGIMPITSLNRLDAETSTFFGIRLPQALTDALVRRADDADAIVQLGASYATLQCSELLAAGAPGIHFYTLNRSPATRAILAALLAARPWERAQ